MIDWYKRYKELKVILIATLVIMNIGIIFCAIKINKKDEKIWQQSVEIEDLKEQLDRERIKR